jgi:cystathionine beta-synthase
MPYAESILDLVGRTPLVRVSRVTRGIGPLEEQPLVLAKLEMVNPGGSVKDRIGLPMIEAAERAGHLRPGGTIIEPTSGGTGHGLAIAAALKGYRCILVMADGQSPEMPAILRAFGAEVVLCPADVPPESPESCRSVAARLARDIPGAFQPDQHGNPENCATHEATTGPEIWEQTEGRITHLVTSVGTGGTITGTARFLRPRRPDLVVVGAEPEGGILSGAATRPRVTDGTGEGFVAATLDTSVVDRWERVSDRDAFAMARRLAREEGILAGESCGTAMVAALAVARELTGSRAARDALMVVILPDTGRDYLATLYSDEWMRTNGLLPTPGGVVTLRDIIDDRHHGHQLPDVVVARTTETVGVAIGRLQEFGISQLPVSEDREGSRLASLVGSITEGGLLARAYRDPGVVERTVGEVMDPPMPQVREQATLDEAFALLDGGASAVLATRGDRPAGIVTRLDLLEYLSHHPRLGS